jgi:soluble lytic murein transglycosylase-like protein
VEASRKHGSFDMRWACASTSSSGTPREAAPRRAADDAALDWDAFSARYFPERRRHDEEALTAYATYKQGREWRMPTARLRLVPPERPSGADEHEREEAGVQRLMAAMAATRHEGASSSRP